MLSPQQDTTVKNELNSISSICVYCGASEGHDKAYGEMADYLGEILARRGIRLVYGGGSIGLMGRIARSVLEHNGKVTGFIPESLAPRELTGPLLGDTTVVDNMHERKQGMAEAADAFVALPGGFGTLEELLEVTTWLTLGFQQKAVGILNVSGFFDDFIRFVDNCVKEGFISPKNRNKLQVHSEPDQLLTMLDDFNSSLHMEKQESGRTSEQGVLQQDVE